MDPCSSPYITIIVVSVFFSIPSFPANQRPEINPNQQSQLEDIVL